MKSDMNKKDIFYVVLNTFSLIVLFFGISVMGLLSGPSEMSVPGIYYFIIFLGIIAGGLLPFIAKDKKMEHGIVKFFLLLPWASLFFINFV
ncbi:MAG: hypothetical protein V4436_02890 [Patescibacteria group bacterium]